MIVRVLHLLMIPAMVVAAIAIFGWINVREGNKRSIVVEYTPDPAATARDNKPRIWRALSGDLMELDGLSVRVQGITCPSPDTGKGRKAKALLNTFLRGGNISCEITITDGIALGVCRKDRRDFAKGLAQSGLCD